MKLFEINFMKLTRFLPGIYIVPYAFTPVLILPVPPIFFKELLLPHNSTHTAAFIDFLSSLNEGVQSAHGICLF